MEGLYFTSTSYLSLGGKGTLKMLVDEAKESATVFSSLGMKEMLNAEKKLSIRFIPHFNNSRVKDAWPDKRF
jgi:hypothetical protein